VNKDQLNSYFDILSAKFVPIGGKVFSRYEALEAGPQPAETTAEENTLNGEGFYFFSSETAEGVLANHSLATAAREVWLSRLTAEFPGREFRCFVSNEHYVWADTRESFTVDGGGVRTLLRMWSLPADHSGFDETYRVSELAPDRVLWREFDDSRLVPLDEVLSVLDVDRLSRGGRECD